MMIDDVGKDPLTSTYLIKEGFQCINSPTHSNQYKEYKEGKDEETDRIKARDELQWKNHRYKSFCKSNGNYITLAEW